MCPVTSGWLTFRAVAAAVLVPSLLGPGPAPTPGIDAARALPLLVAMPLAEAQPPEMPALDNASCGGMRRELHFGWIETAGEIPAPALRTAATCLAVYQLPDARPDPVWQ